MIYKSRKAERERKMKSFKKLLVLSFSVLLPFAMASCKRKPSEAVSEEQKSTVTSEQISEQESEQKSEQISEQASEQVSEQNSEQTSVPTPTLYANIIKESLASKYIGEQQLTADFTLPAVDRTYEEDEVINATISWQVQVGEGVANAVTLDGEPAEGLQKFKVLFSEANEVATSVKLTGTIHVADGDEATIEFNWVVPVYKYATLKEFLTEAKATSSTKVLVVKGHVSTVYKNGLYVVNDEGEGFYAYNPTGFKQADWKQGDLVKVAGTATKYSGQPEFNQGCTATKLAAAEENYAVPFKDISALFAGAASGSDDETFGDLVNTPVKIEGAKVSNIQLNSNGNYFYFTMTGKDDAEVKLYYRGSTSFSGITTDMLNAPMKDWIEGYTVTVQGLLSVYSGNYYVAPITANGYTITDKTLNDQQAANAALNLFANAFRTDYRVPTEVLLDSEDSETGAKFAYTVQDGQDALKLEAGKLIVTPQAAESTVKFTVTTSRGEGDDKKTATKEINVTVGGTTYETITAATAATEANKLSDKTTSEEYYYVKATVSEITDKKYANFNLDTGSDTKLVVYGLYSAENPSQRYGTAREINYVPVYEGEEVVLYAQLSKYNGALQLVNAQLLTKPVKTIEVDGSAEGGYTIYADGRENCSLGDYTVAVNKDGMIIFASRTSEGYGGPGDGFYHDGTYEAEAGKQCGIFNLAADWQPWAQGLAGSPWTHYTVTAPEQGYIITGSYTQMAGLVGQIAGREYTDLGTDVADNALFENQIKDGTLNESVIINVKGFIDPDAFQYTLDASKAELIFLAGEKFNLGNWRNFIVLDQDGHIVYTVANAGAGFGGGSDYARAPMYADKALTIEGKLATVPANCVALRYAFSDEEGTYGNFASTLSDGAVSGSFFENHAYEAPTYAWNKTTNSYITNKTIVHIAYPEEGAVSLELAYAIGKGLENQTSTEKEFTIQGTVVKSGKNTYVTDGNRKIQLYADKDENNQYCTNAVHDDYVVKATGKLTNFNGTIELTGFTALDEVTEAKYTATLVNGANGKLSAGEQALTELAYDTELTLTVTDLTEGYVVKSVLANDVPVEEKDGAYKVTIGKNTVIKLLTQFGKSVPAQNVMGTENFGADGGAKGDGSAIAADDTAGISFKVNGLDVSMTNLSKVNGKIEGATGLNTKAAVAYDANKKATLKLGTGSAEGKFTLTVPESVSLVKLYLANYGNNVVDVVINGERTTLTSSNNDSNYLPYEATPDANHQVTFTTAKNANQSKLAACMLDKIELVGLSLEEGVSVIKATDSVSNAGGLAVYAADHKFRSLEGWLKDEAWVWGSVVIADSEGRIVYLCVNPNSGYGGYGGQSYYTDDSIYGYTNNPVFEAQDDWEPWPATTSGHFTVSVPDGGFGIYCYGEQGGQLVSAITGGAYTAANDDTKAAINKPHSEWNGGRLVYDADQGTVVYYNVGKGAAPEGFVVNPAGEGFTFAWAQAANTQYLLTVKDSEGKALEGFNKKLISNGANFACEAFGGGTFTAELYARHAGYADSDPAVSAAFTIEQTAAPVGFVVNPAGEGFTFAWAAGAEGTTYALTLKDASGNVLEGYDAKAVENGVNFAAAGFDYDVEYTALLTAKESGKIASTASSAKFTRVSPDADASMDFETLTQDSQIAGMGWTQYYLSQEGFKSTSGQMHAKEKNGSKVLNAYCDNNLRKYEFTTGQDLGLANVASIDLGNYWDGGSKGDISVAISLTDYKGKETFIAGSTDEPITIAYNTAAGVVDLPEITFAPLVVKKVTIYTKCSAGQAYLYMDNLTLGYRQLGKGVKFFNNSGDLNDFEWNRLRGVYTGDVTLAAWATVGARVTLDDNSTLLMKRGGTASVGGAVQADGFDNAYANGGNKLFIVDQDSLDSGLWMNSDSTAGKTFRFTYNPVRNAFWVQVL